MKKILYFLAVIVFLQSPLPALAWKAPTQSGLAEKVFYGTSEEEVKKVISALLMPNGFLIEENRPSVLILKYAQQGYLGSYQYMQFSILEGNGNTAVTMVEKIVNPNANSMSGILPMPQESVINNKKTFESDMQFLNNIEAQIKALKAEVEPKKEESKYLFSLQRQIHGSKEN